MKKILAVLMAVGFLAGAALAVDVPSNAVATPDMDGNVTNGYQGYILSPDVNAVIGRSPRIKVTRTTDNVVVTTIKPAEVGGAPNGLALSPTGDHLYVATPGRLRIFAVTPPGTYAADKPGISLVTSISRGEMVTLRGVAVSPDGRFVYVADDNGRVHVISRVDASYSYLGNINVGLPNLGIAVSSDGTRLAFTSNYLSTSGRAYIYDVSEVTTDALGSPTRVARIDGLQYPSYVKYSNDGATLFVKVHDRAGEFADVRIYNTADYAEITNISIVGADEREVTNIWDGLAIAPNDQYIYLTHYRTSTSHAGDAARAVNSYAVSRGPDNEWGGGDDVVWNCANFLLTVDSAVISPSGMRLFFTYSLDSSGAGLPPYYTRNTGYVDAPYDPPSEETANEVPGAPRNLHVAPDADTATTLVWEAAVDDGKVAPLNYIIQYKRGAAGTWRDELGYTTSTSRNLMSEPDAFNLTHGPDYYFRVKAYDGTDAGGAWTDGLFGPWKQIIGPVRVGGPNHAPEEFHLKNPTNGAGVSTRPTLAWDPANDPDGDEVTYTVTYARDGMVATNISGIADTSFTFTAPLASNSLYTWYVTARDGILGEEGVTRSVETWGFWTSKTGDPTPMPMYIDDFEGAYVNDPGDIPNDVEAEDSYYTFGSITTARRQATAVESSAAMQLEYGAGEGKGFGGVLKKAKNISEYNLITFMVQSDNEVVLRVQLKDASGTYSSDDIIVSGYDGWQTKAVAIDEIAANRIDGSGSLARDEITEYQIAVVGSDASPNPVYIDLIQAANNTEPAAFNLISPINGATDQPAATEFDWSSARDSDIGDRVTYILTIDNDADFSSPVLTRGGIVLSRYTLSGDEQLADGTYYWMVTAIDRYGVTIDSTQTDWSFTVSGGIVTPSTWIDRFEGAEVDTATGYYAPFGPNPPSRTRQNTIADGDPGTYSMQALYSWTGGDAATNWGGGWGAALIAPLDIGTEALDRIQYRVRGDAALAETTYRIQITTAVGEVSFRGPTRTLPSSTEWVDAQALYTQMWNDVDDDGVIDVGEEIFADRADKTISGYAFVYDGRNSAPIVVNHYIDNIRATTSSVVIPADVPRNLMAAKEGDNAVLTWEPPTEGEPGSNYQIYRGTSPDTLAAYRDVASGTHTYTDTGAAATSDTNSYYYQITSVSGADESDPSNMAYVLKKTLIYNTPETELGNKNWISIPYDHGYTNILDIADDVNGNEIGTGGEPGTCTKITRWNPTTQMYESRTWVPALSRWLGDPIPVVDGEAFEIVISADTTIVLAGSNDVEFEFNLIYNLPESELGNKNWISIPYDHGYTNILDIADDSNGNEIGTGGAPGTTTKITRWNPTTQLYESRTWVPALTRWLGDPTPIVIGEGFEVVIDADTNFRPTTR